MARSFTELTVNEMKWVLGQLPHPQSEEDKSGYYRVREPIPNMENMYLSNGADVIKNTTLTIYRFKIVNCEWVLV